MKLSAFDKQHLKNLGLSERQIAEIYSAAIAEAAAIGASIDDFNPDKPFSFSDYPQTKKRLDKMLEKLQNSLNTVAVGGITTAWALSNMKNNNLVYSVFGDNVYLFSEKQTKRYYNNNENQLKRFISRKTGGLTLSDRVWKFTNQFKTEIELGLDLGIREGKPAAEIARELKQYLQQPDKLFRRVRDEHGQLHLSKAAAAYNPGQGVYRSSYKNALRMTATETNMAYRTADFERWQQFDFVVGIKIQLSNNHTLNGKPFVDICDDLAGNYPKDFTFTGWHPNCRCFATSILKTTEEFLNNTESKNKVTELPENFTKWVADNQERIERANNRGTLPYFLKDNAKIAGIDVKRINSAVAPEIRANALKKFNSYGDKYEKAYFDKFSGGFNVYHSEHKFSKAGGGGDAEKTVGKMLAKYNGKQVEFLAEGSKKSPDVRFDNKTWDIKSIGRANEETIRQYIRDARKADNAIFYFENTKQIELLRSAIDREEGYFRKNNIFEKMPNIYYIDTSGLLRLLWKK